GRMVIRLYGIIKTMKGRAQKKGKYKKTTLLLPYDLWEELRIESIRKGIPMGELIALKINQLKELRHKSVILEADEHGFLRSSGQ
ncbi:MAG: hypothetical protein ACK42C_01570, partial [Aquificaceae bacterium]